MSYGIQRRAGRRGPAIKSASATLAEGRAWVRDHQAALRGPGSATDGGGAYGIVEQARKDRGPEGRDVRSILEEGRSWIREHKGDVGYQRRKLDEEDRALDARLARSAADIAMMRRELDDEDLHVAGIVERFERWERMRALPATERQARDAVAIHEAGHAVVGYIEGNGIHSVHIDVSANNVVGGLYRPKRGTPSARCSVAGYQAMELAGLGHVLRLSSNSSDYREARRTGVDLERAERDAREMLQTHWPAVKALATELAWAGEIQGEDAERIVRDALSK